MVKQIAITSGERALAPVVVESHQCSVPLLSRRGRTFWAVEINGYDDPKQQLIDQYHQISGSPTTTVEYDPQYDRDNNRAGGNN